MMTEVILHHGDCLDILPTLPAGSVDLVLADLPYGTTGHRWDTPIDLSRLWTEYDRVCKRNAAVLLFAQCPFDKRLGMSNLRNLRYEWVWEKSVATGYQNAPRMPLKASEQVLVFYRSAPTYNPQGVLETRKTIHRGHSPHHEAFTGGPLGRTYVQTRTHYPRNVLRGFARECGHHPTQKPVALLEYLIRTYTNEGDTVLDNTMGSSGSTLVAALRAGRRGIGIESDEGYYRTACERIGGRQKNSLGPKTA